MGDITARLIRGLAFLVLDLDSSREMTGRLGLCVLGDDTLSSSCAGRSGESGRGGIGVVPGIPENGSPVELTVLLLQSNGGVGSCGEDSA